MNEELTIVVVFIGIFVGAGALFFAIRILMKRQNRRAAIYSIKQGYDVFLTWNYQPEDWKAIAEEFFDIKPRRLSENAVASFTERFVYVSNGTNDILYELIGEDRFVKHLTDVYLHKQSERNVIKFEVRTKTIKKDEYGNDRMEEEYDTETFYVPVPKISDAEGAKVLNFYKTMLDKNADAVAAVMPFGLGIFKK